MSIPVLDNLDLNANQLLNFSVQLLATDPPTPFEGQEWLNTTSHERKVCLGGSVLIVQTGLITSADIADGTITDADVAAANKDGASGTASLRTLGTGAAQALAGNTRLDTITAPTGPVALNSQRITGLVDGTAATDAATVQQVQAAAAGIDGKDSVRVATTANITLSGTQTIDTVAVVAGDRVLVKNQTAPEENGIRIVAVGAWARAADMDSWTETLGAFVFVEDGTQVDSGWLSQTKRGGTLGTTAMGFTKFVAAAVSVITKYAADITGDGSATTFTITHNLGTTDVHVSLFDVANDLEVIIDKKRPTTNTCRFDFAVAPVAGKVYRAVVMG